MCMLNGTTSSSSGTTPPPRREDEEQQQQGRDTFWIQHIAFWLAQYAVKPVILVNHLTEYVAEVFVPPSLEDDDDGLVEDDRSAKFRLSLKEWDREHPSLRHDLVVRLVFGGIISIVVAELYLAICPRQWRKDPASHKVTSLFWICWYGYLIHNCVVWWFRLGNGHHNQGEADTTITAGSSSSNNKKH